MQKVLEPLKKQAQNENGCAFVAEEVEPPSFFVCPISMELMLDPVTLTSGQTFDRRSIEQWLESGHVTCPVTRLPLRANEEDLLIPNHTLRRMIQKWCLANNLPRLNTPKPPPTYQEIKSLLQTLLNHDDYNEDQILIALRQLLAMGRHRTRNRQLMLEADTLLAVSSFLANSYNTKINNSYGNRIWLSIASEAWRLMSLLCMIAASSNRHRHRITENALTKHWKPTPEHVSCILWFVAMGENMECKVNATIVLDTLMNIPMVLETRMLIMSMKESSLEAPFMGGLLDILRTNTTLDSHKQMQKHRQRAMAAALRVLNCVARCSYVTNQLVTICIERGGVSLVMEILKSALSISLTAMDPGHSTRNDNHDRSHYRIRSLVEAGTCVLEALVCQSVEGRSSFIDHGSFVQTMVIMIGTVSNRVTESCLEIMLALLTWKVSLVNRDHLVNDMPSSVKRAMVEARVVIKLVMLAMSSSSLCKSKALQLLNLLEVNMDWTSA